MKNELSKMIAAYSGMAATAILAAQQSNAQIIYTNPPDIHLIGVGAHHALDLNNDGVFDVNVSITETTSSGGNLVNNDIIYAIDSDNNPIGGFMYSDCRGDFFYGYGLLPLKSGKVIAAESNIYNKVGWYDISGGELLDWGEYGGTCHRWAGLKSHFIGFRMRPNENEWWNLDYGWIRISVNHSGSRVTIFDWAVNSEINQPIYAGQTMKIENEDMQTENDLEIYSCAKEIFVNQNSQNLPLEISIYNVLGEEVKHITSADENLNIQADQFPSGIYIVKVRSNGENISKEVVIE